MICEVRIWCDCAFCILVVYTVIGRMSRSLSHDFHTIVCADALSIPHQIAMQIGVGIPRYLLNWLHLMPVALLYFLPRSPIFNHMRFTSSWVHAQPHLSYPRQATTEALCLDFAEGAQTLVHNNGSFHLPNRRHRPFVAL